jgi:hypothetical protein
MLNLHFLSCLFKLLFAEGVFECRDKFFYLWGLLVEPTAFDLFVEEGNSFLGLRGGTLIVVNVLIKDCFGLGLEFLDGLHEFDLAFVHSESGEDGLEDLFG